MMAWQDTCVPCSIAEVEVSSSNDIEVAEDYGDVTVEGPVLPADNRNEATMNKGGRPKKRKPPKPFEVGNNVKRLSADRAVDNDDIETDAPSYNKYKRVDGEMCSLARRPSQDDTPGGLRPKTRPPTLLESLSGAPSTAVVTEDRVFNSIIFLDAVSAFSNAHSDVSKGCRVLMRMPVSEERKFGMGYWEAIRCERCGFTRPRQKMYEEGERIPGHTRGPLPGKKNAQLALGLTKVPVGAASVHTLFCSVELSLPTKSSLHNLSTGMAGPLISVAEQALADNRSTLRTVMQLRGDQVEDGKPVAVAAAADGVFNNPCYKGYHQKSTQVALPVRESETAKKMIIGFGFANKFAAVGAASAYPKSAPIGNAEEWLGGKVAQQMFNSSPLLLKALVTDGCGQIFRGFQSATHNLQPGFIIEQQDCTVHTSRRQRACVFKAKFSSQLLTGKVGFNGKVTEETRKAFCTVLSKAIASRCSGELNGARYAHPTDDFKYHTAVWAAKYNILDCYSGNHTKCFYVSFVCRCTPVDLVHIPKYLPRKQYLLLTAEDRVELLEVVLDAKLSDDRITRQRYLRSTNCVEAMHRCMHKSLPKYLLFKKLAEMRAFSAVHSAAVGGVGESIARLGQHFGVGPRSGGEAARRLLQIDRQAHSDKRRQQSDEHRRKRKKTSLSQPSKRVEKIMPETPAPACHLRYEDEHSYLQP
ncbi:Hypp222 [Branchiostoma lanceolatum]|uniref:Hypp219 protein n=1 Tax=Branchiostoma lanceolatum TaxID=7740 RepID=A0A8J9W2K8_BRALA|nr:Hypp219 [Branchiostoma lanceolatum]CAH1228972.1 Hypp220 [Branchiostoma lanceolatum]CAH1228980.1 Hypp222 [Branchiostoma lanceolatum]